MTTSGPDDRPPLVDPRVDRAWREVSREEPPASVDAAILAAAHRDAGAKPQPVGAREARAAPAPMVAARRGRHRRGDRRRRVAAHATGRTGRACCRESGRVRHAGARRQGCATECGAGAARRRDEAGRRQRCLASERKPRARMRRVDRHRPPAPRSPGDRRRPRPGLATGGRTLSRRAETCRQCRQARPQRRSPNRCRRRKRRDLPLPRAACPRNVPRRRATRLRRPKPSRLRWLRHRAPRLRHRARARARSPRASRACARAARQDGRGTRGRHRNQRRAHQGSGAVADPGLDRAHPPAARRRQAGRSREGARRISRRAPRPREVAAARSARLAAAGRNERPDACPRQSDASSFRIGAGSAAASASSRVSQRSPGASARGGHFRTATRCGRIVSW